MSFYRKINLPFLKFSKIFTPRKFSSNYTTTTRFLSKQNPNLCIARRYYYVDQNQVHHFRKPILDRLLQLDTNALLAIGVGVGLLASVYYFNLQTVPYTKRTHFVLLSTKLERKLGDYAFKWEAKAKSWNILPKEDYRSVRVKLISGDIIDGLMRGVKEDRVLDKSQGRSVRATRKHLDGLNWEVFVVDKPIVNAMCFPGGKIVVYTGLLNKFKTDAEIASIIGHEVGHAVGRHSAAGFTMRVVQLVLINLGNIDFVKKFLEYLLHLPFSRKMETEADYIGLLLMASAGYDPRIAVEVEKKLADFGSTKLEYLSTHPAGHKRVKFLIESLEEAIGIYEGVKAGHRARKRREGGLELTPRW
ncbi:hypothetical protein ACHQM5_010907 [Ranunculus cassubicifolius]